MLTYEELNVEPSSDRVAFIARAAVEKTGETAEDFFPIALAEVLRERERSRKSLEPAHAQRRRRGW
jgi:hypothetical protein